MTCMYSELLEASMGASSTEGTESDERGRLEARLLGVVAAARRPPGGGREQVAGDVLAGIARQLDYDTALIRLCRLHGIDCGPERFAVPAAERARLEHVLADAGVLPGPGPD